MHMTAQKKPFQPINTSLKGLVILFFIAFTLLILFSAKGDVVLWFTHHQTSALNLFFKYITHVGDGFVLIPLALVMLYRSWLHFLTLLVATIFQTLFVQVGKQLLFPSAVRPRLFFEEQGIALNFIEGIEVHGFHSFPSGHTAVAFTMAAILIMFTKKAPMQWFWFILAILVGMSRVYIHQHFAMDVYAGSIIGILSGYFAFLIMKSKTNKTQLHKGLKNYLRISPSQN